MTADVLQPIVNAATDLIGSTGLAGGFVLMLLESACGPIPSEAIMPIGRFTLLTAAGSIPWVLMLAIIGREVGSRWEDWRSYLHYLDYAALAAIIIGVAYLVIRRRRAGNGWEPTARP